MRGRSCLRWNVASGALLGFATLVGCGNSSQRTPPVDSSSVLLAQAKPLVGTAWQLDGSKATLKISGDQLLASNGCQFLKGAITIQANVMAINSPAASAGPYCAKVDQQGLAVFSILESGTVHWQVVGDHLELTDADGHALHYSAR